MFHVKQRAGPGRVLTPGRARGLSPMEGLPNLPAGTVGSYPFTVTQEETSGNQPDTDRILAELAGIRAVVDGLAREWAHYRPVVEGFQRGGLLGARTAARRGRRDGP